MQTAVGLISHQGWLETCVIRDGLGNEKYCDKYLENAEL